MRKPLVLTAVGVVAAVAVTWVAVAVWGSSSPTSAAAAPAPRPTDTTWPLGVTAPSAAPPSAAASSTRVASPAPVPPGSAAPFVQAFANQPGVPAQAPLPSPTAKLSMAPNLDGCDHDYGTVAQCVPWTFPAGVTDKCAWLQEHGFVHLKVVGTDRQHLDPDGDRVACD